MFRRFLPLALLAVPLFIACAASDELSATAGTRNAGDDNTLGPSNPTVPSPEGKSNEPSNGVFGSPLCRVTSTTCSPDREGCSPSADGGSAGDAPDASTADFACRVSSNGPTCPTPSDDTSSASPNANRQGVDGIACRSDSDCAPGFDCVQPAGGEMGNDKGTVCRHYCCAGSCDGVTSQNGGPTFCDVRRVVRTEASQLRAPVCVPIKTCTLLKEGDCAVGETCAIVNDKGVTGCVPTEGAPPTGDADGASCEETHCAAGYTCLGSPGDRTCYKLCKMTGGGSQCASGKVCTTGSAFVDTSFGICKTEQ